MKKIFWTLTVVLALAIPATALAVTLQSSHQGVYTCEFGGSWHFVANQTGGDLNPAELVATFSSGTVKAWADHVVQGTQQWTIDGTGTLMTATTTVGKKLVLSDYTCNTKKDGK